MSFFIEKDFVVPELNFLSSERIDSFLFIFPNSLYLFLQIVILGLGAYFLFELKERRNKKNIFKVVIFIISILSVVGLNPIFLRFHWYPFLVCSFLLLYRNFFLGITLSMPVIFLWIVSSGSLSVFGLWFAFLSVFFIRKNAKNDMLVFLILSISSVFAYFNIPYFNFSDYPYGARLIPLSGQNPLPNPLFGPYYHVETIFKSIYLDQLKSKGLIIFANFVSIIFPSFWLIKRSSIRKNIIFLIVTLFFIFSELLFRASFVEYSLFAITLKMIPGVAIARLPWIFYPIIFLTFLFLHDGSKKTYLCSIVLCSSILAYSICSAPKEFNYNSKLASEFLSKDNLENKNLIASSYIVNYWGDWILDKNEVVQRDYSKLKWLRPNVDYKAEFDASVGSEHAWKAGDGDSKTRWATSRPQASGDTFKVHFDKEIEFLKIILSIQKTPSDFPRGLKIVKYNSDNSNKVIIFEKENWVGPVKWTSTGKPYFGHQSEVIIDFAKPIKADALEFIQISNDTIYDWSIGELKFFR